MRLSSEQYSKYVNAINRIKASTVSDLESMLRRVWKNAGGSSKSSLDAICIEYSKAIAKKYGLAAASVSAALWEDIYYNDTGSRLEALLPEDDLDDRFGDAAKEVLGKSIEADDWDSALSFLAGITTKAVHDYARRTQMDNTKRVARKRYKGSGEARYMRIPTGAETCAWCLMLAGRGPIYVSALSAGSDERELNEMGAYHYHMWCDCDVIASFSKDFGIGGYDWHVYENEYKAARAYDDQGRVDLSETLHNMRQMYGYR